MDEEVAALWKDYQGGNSFTGIHPHHDPLRP